MDELEKNALLGEAQFLQPLVLQFGDHVWASPFGDARWRLRSTSASAETDNLGPNRMNLKEQRRR